MDKIVAKILDYFQDVLVELNKSKEMKSSFLESRSKNPSHSIPPTFIIAEQNEYPSYFTEKKGKCLGRWKVGLSSIETFVDDPQAIKLEENGMYYSRGFGEFSIHENGEVVLVSWQVGPRYGRGYQFSMVQHNGAIELTNQKELWIS